MQRLGLPSPLHRRKNRGGRVPQGPREAELRAGTGSGFRELTPGPLLIPLLSKKETVIQPWCPQHTPGTQAPAALPSPAGDRAPLGGRRWLWPRLRALTAPPGRAARASASFPRTHRARPHFMTNAACTTARLFLCCGI